MVAATKLNGSEGSMLPPDELTSPRETRRSGRRSLPLVHTSVPSSSTPKSSQSNSPGQEEHPPVLIQNLPQSKKRRSIKDEAEEGSLVEYKPSKREEAKGRREKLMVDTKSVSNNAQGKGRSKRKSKAAKEEKMVETPVEEVIDSQAIDGEDPDGRTRCICGNTTGAAEDDDELTFWIQCETCKVWQHGRCVGYEKESDAPEHYHCEECRPDLHEDLRHIKPSRARPPSMRPSRASRSRSPHAAMVMAMQQCADKGPKRRNTMNSRETAYFDEMMMKQVQEGASSHPDRADSLTAPERTSVAPSSAHLEEEQESREQEVNTRKKRRSMTTPVTEQQAKARSESSGSDRPIIASMIMDQHLPIAQGDVEEEAPVQTAPIPVQKRKRGQRKDGADSKRHPNQYTYRRGNNARDNNKNISAQGSNATPTPTPTGHEHGTRRNPQSNRGQHLPAPQPLLTSWGLPDYLAHLAPLLPTPVPVPLQIPISSANGGKYEEERGVKVKWPGKRMSTVDMVKRVRQLMEWVGREQANHNEREKRRIKIEQAVAEEAVVTQRIASGETEAEGTQMDVDGTQDTKFILTNSSLLAPQPLDPIITEDSSTAATSSLINGHNHKPKTDSPSLVEKPTAQLMEELMLELISFQEKYGVQTNMNELLSL